MIYSKDASFSYPVFSNTNYAYEQPVFNFEVTNVNELNNDYELSFEYDLQSDFLQELLSTGKAILILILSSSDSQFYKINPQQSTIKIPKSRLSFAGKVNVQLHIQSAESINFASCEELNQFFSVFKSSITTSPKALLGYSNVSTVRNTGKNGVQLFVSEIDPTLKTDFTVRLSEDAIHLVFKEKEFLLRQVANKKGVMNMYLYIGLDRAIKSFIESNIQSTNGYQEASLFLSDLETHNLNNLEKKLYDLMASKNIDEIIYEDIDQIIQQIAPAIIRDFTASIERLHSNGN